LSRADAKEAILQAVEILQGRHDVGATSAYTILVQASVDSRLNVHETAGLIVLGASPGTA